MGSSSEFTWQLVVMAVGSSGGGDRGGGDDGDAAVVVVRKVGVKGKKMMSVRKGGGNINRKIYMGLICNFTKFFYYQTSLNVLSE